MSQATILETIFRSRQKEDVGELEESNLQGSREEKIFDKQRLPWGMDKSLR